ncbi:hypothetical protein ACFSCX_21785 [Bacillus salitolerans]|uniref:YhjD n=1 Tax=Bacillus salitolerans TaxID=1437434 RepID=A0ABW4LW36_9BACI
MTRIPDEDRNLLEQSLFLPMTLTVFQRDLQIIEKAPFKLKQPYLRCIEESMNHIQRDLAIIKHEMKKKKLKAQQLQRDDTFTTFLFVYKGYEEQHNYFNPRIRNCVQSIMEKYLLQTRA